LTKKTIDLENRSRRNNLRIDGVKEKPGETWNECENTVKDIFKNQLKINSEVVVERAHRVGKTKDSKIPRTIVLKLLNYQDKNKILNAVKNLKGTGVFINEDFAKETIESRKTLWEEVKRLRGEGKYAVIKYDKIFCREFKNPIPNFRS
jgi:DNA-directed RNA polymerase beta subunit